ncbi:MAG TPA: hypothetical protein DCW74_16750 [Alteromonas australica]|uniref:Uncharacterized protein n=1 Tax=Alteromonas australica TaxID=589873 RepID=A0A350P7V2_9ALTE|nr:hypothetical protein [Alteromonas australica]
MDPRFGGNVGAMLGGMQPQGNYLHMSMGVPGMMMAGNPSFDIKPKSGPGTPGYSIYNDPKLPGARQLRRKLEETLGLPRIQFPQA